MQALLTARERAVIAEYERRQDIKLGGRATPLPDSVLGFEEWNSKWYSGTKPFAPHHYEFWEWFESLEQGVRPPSYLAVWNRGAGKSETLERGVVRTAVRGSRNFALIVCAVQKAADTHVTNIAAAMERNGIERALTTYGMAKNWNASKLRCSNGFNVLGYGLEDAQGRGVKLDQFRPDLILFDDIDVLGRSVMMTEKMLDTIKSTIIPSGSTDVAYCFVQNIVTANGIMARTLDGRADMLNNRVPVNIIPAVRDLKGDIYYETGRKRFRITGGEPTWAGKDLQTCQLEIDDQGYESFMRESQHDVYRTGVFFTNLSEELHVRRMNQSEGVCPVCEGDEGKAIRCQSCRGEGIYTRAPWPIPHGWKAVGGLDYGKTEKNPFAFLLEFFDFDGNKYVVDEIYESMLSPEAQADLVLELFKQYGLNPRDVEIFCDPSIFPAAPPAIGTMQIGKPEGFSGLKPDWSMTSSNGRKISDVYKSKGLNVRSAMRANTGTERINGWGAVNYYLDNPGMMTIYDGRCPNFLRTMRNLPKDANDDRDADTDAEDHLPDCDRFISRNRNLKAKPKDGDQKRDTLQATQKPSNDWYS